MENLKSKKEKNIMKKKDTEKKIFSTKDYKIFKFLPKGNRKPSVRQVNRIVFSVNRKDLLEDFPIIVTEDFFVLDGQGRVEACKKLNVPVWYKITTDMNVDDIPLINSTRTSWTMQDYFNKYLDQNNPNYIKLDQFIKKTNISKSINTMLRFFYKKGITKDGADQHLVNSRLNIPKKVASISAEFKLGLFVYPANDKYVWDKVQKLKSFSKYINIKQPVFIGAFFTLLKNVEYDHNRMLKNLESQSFKLKLTTDKKEYFVMFNDIYNHHHSTNNLYLKSVA